MLASSVLGTERYPMESLEWEVGTRSLKLRKVLCEDVLHHWKRHQVFEQVSVVLVAKMVVTPKPLSLSRWEDPLRKNSRVVCLE